MIIKNYIEIDNKKISYFIEPINSEISKITCKIAKIFKWRFDWIIEKLTKFNKSRTRI